jgi:FKBP-type peptidyl-prolyl cis-trans isomerase FkpA
MKKLSNTIGVCLLAMAFSSAFSPVAVAQTEKPTTIQEKYSYSMGYQFGKKVQGIVTPDKEYFRIEQFMAAMRAALTDQNAPLSEQEMSSIMKLTTQALREKRNILAQAEAEKGAAFAQTYAQESDVQKSPGGVLYRIVREGEGDAPNRRDKFLLNFEGSLPDGEVFVSSYQSGKPNTFSYDSIISGWQEVLPMMKPGSEVEVVVPPELGYGERGLASQGVPANATLKFKLEMVEVQSAQK